MTGANLRVNDMTKESTNSQSGCGLRTLASRRPQNNGVHCLPQGSNIHFPSATSALNKKYHPVYTVQKSAEVSFLALGFERQPLDVNRMRR